jgi:hypothetical protein
MANAAYYREEAERCRKLAAAGPDSVMALRWRQLAAEYDQLADALTASEPRPSVLEVPMQQQPAQQQVAQQQQSRAEPEDKEEDRG